MINWLYREEAIGLRILLWDEVFLIGLRFGELRIQGLRLQLEKKQCVLLILFFK